MTDTPLADIPLDDSGVVTIESRRVLPVVPTDFAYDTRGAWWHVGRGLVTVLAIAAFIAAVVIVAILVGPSIGAAGGCGGG